MTVIKKKLQNLQDTDQVIHFENQMTEETRNNIKKMGK